MTQTTPPERQRIAFDLSQSAAGFLEHVSEVTGVSKAGIATAALLVALPALLARADAIKKRHGVLSQGKARK